MGQKRVQSTGSKEIFKEQIGPRIITLGHRFWYSKRAFGATKIGRRTGEFGRRFRVDMGFWILIFCNSGTEYYTSGPDFSLAYLSKLRFLIKGSQILRPKAYFWSRGLKICWATIKTNSQSSITCMNLSSYASS